MTLTLVAPGVWRGVGVPDSGSGVFILGRSKPSADNTGCDESTLSNHPDGTHSRLVYVDEPTVFEDLDMGNTRFSVRSSDVVFRNCRWIVTDNSTAEPMISTNSTSAFRVIVEHCTMRNEDQDGWRFNAIEGHDVTVTRCDISGFTDLIRPNLGGNVRILGNHLHHPSWWGSYEGGPYLNTGNQSHSDCIQTTYGGVEIVGNTIEAFPATWVGTGTPGNGTDAGNSAGWYTQAQGEARFAESFTETTDHGPLGGMLTPLMCNRATGDTALRLIVRRNWFNGGQLHVNALATNLTSPLGVFEGNRHGLDGYFRGAGKPICYRLADGLDATFAEGADANLFIDGTAALVV